MELLKKNWRIIAISLIMLVLGIILASAFKCKRSDGTSVRVSIDSLKRENVSVNAKYNHLSDSITAVVKIKDSEVAKKEAVNRVLVKKLSDVSAKYAMLIATTPNIDTTVGMHDVYRAKECFEKMPILQTQISNCQSEVSALLEIEASLKSLVKVKTDHNLALQGQLDRSIVINERQAKENRKLTRQKRANKAWAVITTAGVGMLGVALLVVH